MFIYIILIFTSSFLVFFIQPLISKYLLPWFGGVSFVWVISLMFFQFFLFLGYLYSHILIKKYSILKQFKINSILLVLSVFSIPIIPSIYWQDKLSIYPEFILLFILIITIGLPFIIISSASPLVQYLFFTRNKKESPYFLYSVSNIGSILGLLSYPLLFEKYFDINSQAIIWSFLFLIFIFIYSYLFYHVSKNNRYNLPEAKIKVSLIKNIKLKQKIVWFIFPVFTTVMLLAVTHEITTNIAPMPLLWVLPLLIFLLTYVIAFSKYQIYYNRLVYMILFIISAIAVFFYFENKVNLNLYIQLIILNIYLFIFCLVGHIELYNNRPGSENLSYFYLFLAGGGAIGGVSGGIILPKILPISYELHVFLVLFLIILLYFYYKENVFFNNKKVISPFYFLLLILPFVFVMIFCRDLYKEFDTSLYLSRGFYGTLAVKEGYVENTDRKYRYLVNGSIVHGLQFLDQDEQDRGTTYYSSESAVGLILDNYKVKNRKICLVGLGVGTLLNYNYPNDYFRIYEINPEVEKIAKNYFYNLKNVDLNYDIILGDARLNLTKNENILFDVLVVDAFSGDSIPIHLLTKEAFDIYDTRIKSNGFIIFHISNIYPYSKDT